MNRKTIETGLIMDFNKSETIINLIVETENRINSNKVIEVAILNNYMEQLDYSVVVNYLDEHHFELFFTQNNEVSDLKIEWKLIKITEDFNE